jgi:hypothetical protein
MSAGDEQNTFDSCYQWQSGQHVSLNAFQRGEIGEPALSHGQMTDDLVEGAAVGRTFEEPTPTASVSQGNGSAGFGLATTHPPRTTGCARSATRRRRHTGRL